MFRIIIPLVTILGILCLTACEEFEDERLDFSNSLPAYAQFSSGSDIATTEGSTVDLRVEIPPTKYPDIVVSYEVTGAFTASGSVTVPGGDRDADFTLDIPTGIVGVDSIPVNATISLTAATEGVVIGRRTGDKTSRKIEVGL